jgi:hypothetical protein
VTDDRLRRLTDESELRDLIHRYAFGLDDRDWTLWRSVFADEVVIDMSDYQPEPPPRPSMAEQIVRSAEVLFAGFEATQHFIGTQRYDIAGDTAVITAHMRAEHWLTTGKGADRYTMYGTYIDECVRTADGWKLTRVKLCLLREEGNREVMRSALRRGRAHLEKQPASTEG